MPPSHIAHAVWVASPRQVHATVLQPEDMWKGYNYGGKWVYFEPWELNELGKEEDLKIAQLVEYSSSCWNSEVQTVYTDGSASGVVSRATARALGAHSRLRALNYSPGAPRSHSASPPRRRARLAR